jgi:two-component system LytT family response regulator
MQRQSALKAIHVDDDISSIENLQALLQKISGIEYLQGFTSPTEALTFIENEEIDLIFLDVEMPEYDGFWLAEQIKDLSIKIIFVTAHTGYAAKAFEICALNYLVKPTNIKRLEEVVEQAVQIRMLENPKQKDQLETLNQYLDPELMPKKLFLVMAGSIRVVVLDEVFYFASNRNYTEVAIKNGERLISSKTIKTFADTLKKLPDFARINRSYIINKNYLKSIVRDSDGNKILLEMKNGDKIATSYRTKEEAMDDLFN